MRTRIVEVTNGFNHGKFLVGQFDSEMTYRSHVGAEPDRGPLLLMPRWGLTHLLVVDLETGEGALFQPGGLVKYDLDKHSIWVCPMFEPFLGWLYEWYREDADLDDLPRVVLFTEDEAPSALSGYRRTPPPAA